MNSDVTQSVNDRGKFVVLGWAPSDLNQFAVPFVVVAQLGDATNANLCVYLAKDARLPSPCLELDNLITELTEAIRQASPAMRTRFFEMVSGLNFGHIRTCLNCSFEHSYFEDEVSKALEQSNTLLSTEWPGMYFELK